MAQPPGPVITLGVGIMALVSVGTSGVGDCLGHCRLSALQPSLSRGQSGGNKSFWPHGDGTNSVHPGSCFHHNPDGVGFSDRHGLVGIHNHALAVGIVTREAEKARRPEG